MKFEIKSWFNGGVLFSLETDSLKLCLEAAVKSRANLAGANLAVANLTDAYLVCANLTDANLTGANLTGANLTGANLTRAYLTRAYLTRANLTDANLVCANLTDANLVCANLTDAYLMDANLAGANLAGANLAGANLAVANLAGANLTGAKGINKLPIQIPGHKHFISTTQEGELRIGCEQHSFDEWREIPDKLGANNGYGEIDIEIYKLHIEHIAKVSRLLWNKKEQK